MKLPPIRLFVAGVVTAFGGAFHFGYQLAYVNPTLSIFEELQNRSLRGHYGIDLDDTAARFLWAAVGGFTLLGAMIGALLMPLIAERRGRRFGLGASTIVILVSVPISAVSQYVDSFLMFAVGRLICGVGIGLITGFQALFLNECSPDRHRGFVGTLTGTMVELGFAFGSFVGTPLLLGRQAYWSLILWVEAVPSLLLLVCLFFFHETPKFLLVRGQEAAARRAIRFYYGARANVETAMKDLKIELSSESVADTLSTWQLFGGGQAISRGAYLGVLTNVCVSFSGVVAWSLFAVYLLQSIGLDHDTSSYFFVFAAFLGAIVPALINSWSFDRLGRRPLMIGSIAALLVTTVLVLVTLLLFNQYGWVWLGYTFAALYVLFMMVFAGGLGPLSWFITVELVPQRARSASQGVAICAQYLTGFVTPIIFFPLEKWAGPWSFLLFIIPMALVLLNHCFLLPETNQRSIEDIMDDLDPRRKKMAQIKTVC